MIDPITARTWAYRCLYVVLFCLLAFIQILPVHTHAGRLPGPDLMTALTFAWVLRRPSYVPVLLITAMFLTWDLIAEAPPGIGAATMVLASEFLRSRRQMSRTFPFTVEWALVSVVLIGMAVLYQMAMMLTLLHHPPVGLALTRAVFTSAAYPLVVLVSHYLLRVRAADPAEADALGRRL